MKVTCCHVLSLLTASLLGACSEPSPHAEPEPEAEAAQHASTDAELIADADARQSTERLRAASAEASPERRRLAFRELARMHLADEAPTFLRGLRDTDAEVRGWASLGLAAFEADAPPSAAPALARAIAAETDPATRAWMIRDVARLRSADGVPAVSSALRAENPSERAAGCAGAAEYGLGGEPIPAPMRSRIASLIGPAEDRAVRLACAYALTRLPAPDPATIQAELVALTVATADEDAEVRAFAYRALGKRADAELETLVHGTRDQDWRVAVQAVRSLAARAAGHDEGPAVYAHALENAHQRAVPDGRITAGGPFHVLLAALDAAAPLARTTPIHDAAVRVHAAMEQVPTDAPPTRDRGIAHCAAAELVDRARGWPSRVDTCGLEQVPPSERQVRAAAILGDLEGAEEQRAALLTRLYRHGDALVREAVLRACARVWHPDATEIVVRALRDHDPGVLTAASEAIAAIARRSLTEARVPPPLPAEPTERALRAAGESLPDGELEALATWLDAADATDARTLLPRVRALALHPSYAVRGRARRVLTRWEETLPIDPVPPSPNVIGTDAVLAPTARPRVRLRTDRGDLVLELRPDAAPTTVARFLGLVRDGFYDGLTFHRVVPGFVTQGGDPRGDGFGGPGFWQRCEDNRLPYVRGTVGMALAGRDTGGSQFFIAQAAQPHLEGRYTAFAMVVDGLENLDLIQAGDHIRTAEIVSE